MKTSQRHLLALGLAASTLLAAGTAQAQSTGKAGSSGVYGEIGFTSLEYKEPSVKATPKQIRLVGGYEVHPNLAIEGLVGFGAKDDQVSFEGESMKFNVDYIAGVFLKPKVAVTPELELFGRVGYVRSKRNFSASMAGYDLSIGKTSNDAAYGLGATYALNEKISLNFDYMSYLEKDDEKIKGFTFGVGLKF